MAGKFERKPFSQIDLRDPFFASLKKDYPEFEHTWFPKGVRENREALIFSDEIGLGAFIALKEENEPIVLKEETLPAKPRLKISTLRLAERFRGQRLGEGAIGTVLWDWQRSRLEEVYLTVFPYHDDLISQVERFGFIPSGHTPRGELVYIRNRCNIDFSDPYKSFPFISPDFEKGGYLIVDDGYHDTLFPYSELQNVFQDRLDADAANGVSKVYIGQLWQPHYRIGEPVFIYRKYTGESGKRFRSCLTSFCVITGVSAIKRNGVNLCSFAEFQRRAGNKTVFSEEELLQKYQTDRNITIIQMLYCGYFGAGNNINLAWLEGHSLWNLNHDYPLTTRLTPQQCKEIMRQGKIDVDNVFGG